MSLIQKKLVFLHHGSRFVDYISGAQLLFAFVLLIIVTWFQSLVTMS